MSLAHPPGVDRADDADPRRDAAVAGDGAPGAVRRLDGRLRLERVLRTVGPAEVWLALDEKLRRGAIVHLTAPGADALGMIAAARSAAALLDPHFLRGLDAVDDGTAAWAVTEWPT